MTYKRIDVEGKTIDEIIHEIKKLSGHGITSVCLSNQKLGEKSIEDLVKIINALKGTGVTDLNLARNALGSKSVDDLLTLLRALRGSGVTKLNLDFNDFEKKSGKDFATILQGLKDTEVTSLLLAINQFESCSYSSPLDYPPEFQPDDSEEPYHFIELACMLKGFKDLKVTDLSLVYNTWLSYSAPDKGSEHIMQALKGSKLKRLSLACNDFGDECGITYHEFNLEDIIKSLQDVDITHLDLSANGLSHLSDKGLDNAFKKLKDLKVTYLDLRDNDLGQKLNVILPALENTSVENINLGGNSLDRISYKELRAIFSQFPENIKSIGLKHSEFKKMDRKQREIIRNRFPRFDDLILFDIQGKEALDFKFTRANARLMAQASRAELNVKNSCPLGKLPAEVMEMINDYALGSVTDFSIFTGHFDRPKTRGTEEECSTKENDDKFGTLLGASK